MDLEAVPATCKYAGVGVSIMKTKGSFLSKKYSLWAVALAALMAMGSPAFAQHGGGVDTGVVVAAVDFTAVAAAVVSTAAAAHMGGGFSGGHAGRICWSPRRIRWCRWVRRTPRRFRRTPRRFRRRAVPHFLVAAGLQAAARTTLRTSVTQPDFALALVPVLLVPM